MVLCHFIVYLVTSSLFNLPDIEILCCNNEKNLSNDVYYRYKENINRLVHC